MARTAEQTARAAELTSHNAVGMCLQVCRNWAGIGAKYPDATTAARHAHRHKGVGPRGSFAYWVGGSHGHGHIAINLGGGKIRSTDAGGAGNVATVPLGWVHEHWGLTYAGWAWDVNDVAVVHPHPAPPPPTPVTGEIVRCLHASLQFSDNPAQHRADAKTVFDHAAKVGAKWVTGTEAGPGSGGLAGILKSAAAVHGYRFFTVDKTDGWLAVLNSFVRNGWLADYHEIFPGQAHLHASRGIVSASFETADLGTITVGTAHLLTKGQKPGDPFFHANSVYTEAIGKWAQKVGAGKQLCFFGGDMNEQDTVTDTFRGQPLTSLWDELNVHQGTGHGEIDIIASYDADGRTKGHSVRSYSDRELFLNSDHFLVEGSFEVRRL